MTIDGYFLDAYPTRDGMTVWFLDENGAPHHCLDQFHPSFYLRLEPQDERRLPTLLQGLKVPVTLGKETKLELFSGEEWSVSKVTVHNPLLLPRTVWSLQKFFPHFAFYNSNIPVVQMYLYDRQAFPLARCKFEINSDNVLKCMTVNDRFDDCNYPDPPLKIMRLDNVEFPNKFFRTLKLEVSYENATYSLEQEDPQSTLEALNWHLYRYDPDIILTSWGDATLLPTIVTASHRYNVPLLLNRDQSHGYLTMKERSYWTYGQIIHRDAAFMLAGRLHMDAENSFFMGESDLEGIIELSRLTQLPLQKQSRAAIGTGLASMQMSYAYRNNILIPAEKKEGEDFKTADELLLSDRGGLIFLPELGYHEQVAELDFASMYPTLMEHHNISPETVNCSCCLNDAVPELNYTICERRQHGIVPVTLKPVIEKRAEYKKRRNDPKLPKAEREKYDRRQNALKWMLVTCFGYLGYKNARFGRIEAHEAVNAYSREALLKAKEIAEENGYHLVHAIVDCLWLKKPGATRSDYQALCAKIKNVVNVEISLEGIYNWILFPHSKTDPEIGTPQKYVGWYDTGIMKMRGIEARRRDTPLYIKQVQQRLLEMLSDTKNIVEIRARIPELLREVQFYLNELRSGRVNPRELVLRRRVRHDADGYTNNSINAMVMRELKEFGVEIKPGETIEFIVIDQTGKREPQKAKSLLTYQHWDGYDVEKYSDLLLKSVETLLQPFGYDWERLQQHFSVSPSTKVMQSKIAKEREFEKQEY